MTSLLRAAELTASLAQRRADLIRLFGEDVYAERTALAKERIREVMKARQENNSIKAAIAYSQSLAAHHAGKDVSTTQQFVLCAAADMAEGL